jgi:3-methyladenine DNA glycosylase AlkD
MKEVVRQLYFFLKEYENQEVAVKQEQYMRNQFPFFGLMRNERNLYFKKFQSEFQTVKSIDAVLFCKECIQYDEREMWYIGLDFLIKNKKTLLPKDIDFIFHLIIESKWWDIVDLAASNLLGYFGEIDEDCLDKIKNGKNHNNLWIRRSAIIFQLKYKHKTDWNYLSEIALELSSEKTFFIDKAIGWALREYAKVKPEIVKTFIENYKNTLNPLSIREGLKHLKSY